MACRIIVQVFEDRRDIKGRALIESWRRIFGALASLVQVSRVLEDGTDDEVEHISICFNWLSSVDARNEDDDRDDRGKYLAWRAAFKPEESPVPDSFYLVLMDIYVPDERYWRVGRLQEMTAQEREAAAKDTLDNNAVDPSTGRDDGPIKDDEHGPGSTGGQVSTDPVDEESPDDVSSEDVLPEPGDDPDVIIRDGGQGLVSSGDGGEKAGTDLGRDEGILDEVLHRSEGEHVTTFR
ncbi:hypothetical protein BDW22DRAFT_1355047 [Trametopsis cervina]|nr:hypothetical protein BDW22DRAFT_1355047 [Trametopsis cervina]